MSPLLRLPTASTATGARRPAWRNEGPRIAIPSGAEITGEYDRHGFRYDGPEGDPEAGQTIVMRQLSDEEMLLRRIVGGQAQPVENWRRCQAIG